MRWAMRVACVVATLFAAAAGSAQLSLGPQFGSRDGSQGSHSKGAVTYDDRPQQIEAGKPQVIELRFVVAPGFHINSATPKSTLLIPTVLNALPEVGVRQEKPQYPAGTVFSFPSAPDEKLDVYGGTFIVKLPLVAKAGAHTIDATLHYQACDNASCYPPRDLGVPIIFFAK